MKLIIEDDEGRKTVVPIARDEITIGRQDGNTIRLTERNVSRRHARLLKDNGALLIEDLGSYNGVRVNGDRISGPTKIKEGDLIEIGDYDLGIEGKFDAPVEKAGRPTPGAVRPAGAPRSAGITLPPQRPGTADATAPVPPLPAPGPPSAAVPEPQPAAPPPSAGGATAIIRVSDIMKNAPQVEVRDLAKGEMPRLVGLAGPVRGKEFYLMRTEVKFGRTEDNDIGVDHQSVSRQHCRFVLDEGAWKIVDSKSANGVRVNGEEYAISAVKSGDTLELGHLKFRFCAPGEKFALPPEKAEGEKAAGGMKPTTAEPVAGASGKAPSTNGGRSRKSGVSMGVAGGVVAAVVLLGAAAVVVMGRGGPRKGGEEPGQSGAEGLSAEDAIRQGDALFKKQEFIKAYELYQQAAAKNASPANRKRAGVEAKGQETYRELESAIAAGEFDKARGLSEKCATDTTYWCGKAQEKADAVKAGYARAHLARAAAAKSAGKPDACRAEANLVLAFDSSSGEAQAALAGCQPPAEPVAARPEPRARASMSLPGSAPPAERNAKASELALQASADLQAKDFSAVVRKCNQALALHPTDKATLTLLYRNLGYAYGNSGEFTNAKKYLKLYLPSVADPAEKEKLEQFVARH